MADPASLPLLRRWQACPSCEGQIAESIAGTSSFAATGACAGNAEDNAEDNAEHKGSPDVALAEDAEGQVCR